MQEEMKKKAAAEALKDLISQMLGLEGKKMMSDPAEAVEEAVEGGKDGELKGAGFGGDSLVEEALEAAKGDEDVDEEEKKDYMSLKRKPVVKKSMTIVMSSPKSKGMLKKKLKGL